MRKICHRLHLQLLCKICFLRAALVAGITFHWGSAAVKAPDHIVAQYSADECSQRASEQQGRADLLQWLRMRAKELKPGGHLIATAIGSGNDVLYEAIRKIFDLANTCWNQTRSEGHITSSEHAATHFPLYFFDLKACLALINEELSEEYEVVQSSSGSASKVSSKHGAASQEEVSNVSSEGIMAVLAPEFRKVVSERPQPEQDRIMFGFKQALKQECLASNFVPSTQYILLALRRK